MIYRNSQVIDSWHLLRYADETLRQTVYDMVLDICREAQKAGDTKKSI